MSLNAGMISEAIASKFTTTEAAGTTKTTVGEPARDGLKLDPLIQKVRVIVNAHREQARSYSDTLATVSALKKRKSLRLRPTIRPLMMPEASADVTTADTPSTSSGYMAS